MSEDRDIDRRWHVSREVALSVLVGIVFQTAGLIWWARGVIATMEQRVALLEQFRTDQQVRDKAQDDALHSQGGEVKQLLQRLEDKVDRLLVDRRR